MSEIKLQANLRQSLGKKNKKLIKQNKIPAVIYGPKTKNQNIELNYTDFIHVYQAAGKSTLIDLAVGQAAPIKALIYDYSLDPLTSRFNHIDFYELDMTKPLTVEVELILMGESVAVKQQKGELIKVMDTLEVKCLPKDLVKSIDIDLSSLKNIGDHIYAREVKLPPGLELMTDPDLVIVSAEEIKEEVIEEAKPAETVPVAGEAAKAGEAAPADAKAGDKAAAGGKKEGKKE